MTWWALFDKLLPVAAVIAAGVISFRLGRAYERIDWLTAAAADATPQSSEADHG